LVFILPESVLHMLEDDKINLLS